MTIEGNHDADTISGWISLGLDEFAWIDIRLRDVHAHEMHDPDPGKRRMAEESREHLSGLLPPGTQARVHTERYEGATEQASFSRFVAVVELPGGRNINEEMIEWLREMGYEGGM